MTAKQHDPATVADLWRVLNWYIDHYTIRGNLRRFRRWLFRRKK